MTTSPVLLEFSNTSGNKMKPTFFRKKTFNSIFKERNKKEMLHVYWHPRKKHWDSKCPHVEDVMKRRLQLQQNHWQNITCRGMVDWSLKFLGGSSVSAMNQLLQM